MRQQLIPYKNKDGWPEWANLLIGIKEGFMCFESEKEGRVWYEAYKGEHPYVPSQIQREEDQTFTNRIGFAA